jgi:hypothetical protein
MDRYSAIGPKVNAGKNDNAATIRITVNMMTPKVAVSVFNVPSLSGIYFFWAIRPAIATGPIMGKNRESIKTNPVLIFHQTVLSPKPSKPLPLLAEEEVYSYNISLNP